MNDLIRENYEPYITSVGGSGLGILSPHPEHHNRGAFAARTHKHTQAEGQVTPPDTPAPEGAQLNDTAATGEAEMLRVSFETSSVEGLTEWANGLGKWLYV